MPASNDRDSTHCHATIAICTYNRMHTLPRTLQSLALLRGPYKFEVLIVNGPSTDGTTEFLAGVDNVRVFSNDEINLAISRNIAIANAAGEYIAFIDDDAVPEPDWLTLLIDRFNAEPDLSAAGGFIRDASGMSFQARYVYCDVFGKAYPCENADYITFMRKDRRLYLSLTGTNVIFRRKDILQIDGFDEVFAYFLDETDVNKRMDDEGMRVAVVPAAEIHHKFAASHLRTEKNVSKDMYPTSRSISYFVIRHAVQDVGWEEAVRYLQKFYKDEFFWKCETYSSGHIEKSKFEELIFQVKRGIIDGINLAFGEDSDRSLMKNRISRHCSDRRPIIRSMRRPEDVLRLCMFSQDHSGRKVGGIGRWTKLAARGLAERGHEITVIGELTEGSHREHCDFTAHGFWSHNVCHFEREESSEVDCLGLPTNLANASKRKLAELRRIMPRRQFQVASTPIWDVEGAALIGCGDIPAVVSLHTCAGLMLESKPEWRENQVYYENHVLRVINAEIQALRRSKMVLANSKAIMNDISNIYDLDLFKLNHAVVPHGLEDILEPEPLLEERIAAHANSDAPIRILFLGRLETRKGVSHMVAVLRKILSVHSNVMADIVGDKVDSRNFALVSDLIKEFAGRVIWHGFLDDSSLDTLMRKTDVFFAPSTYESFGLIYAEAMRYSVVSLGVV